jgi:hypothetical protein
MKNVFWDITPHSPVKVSQSFIGMGSPYCLLPAGFLLVQITFFQGQYFEKLKLLVMCSSEC